jgi:hypothetical protein
MYEELLSSLTANRKKIRKKKELQLLKQWLKLSIAPT